MSELHLEDARREIIGKISDKSGFKIEEEFLSPSLRQKITMLAQVWRNLIFLKQMIMSENTRAEQLRSYYIASIAIGIIGSILMFELQFVIGIVWILIFGGISYTLFNERHRTYERIANDLKTVKPLDEEIISKINEFSEQGTSEKNLLWMRQTTLNVSTGVSTSQTQLEPLKCSICGASLPLPIMKFFKCSYCGTIYPLKEIVKILGENLKTL